MTTTAALLRAHARKLRAEADTIDAHADTIDTADDPILDGPAVEARYGIRIRTLLDAARRGEPIDILRAGRSPRVRASQVDAWLARRPSPKAPASGPRSLTDDVDDALAAAAGGRSR
jgi:hypothetical protein